MIKTILTILVISFPVFAQSVNQSFKRDVLFQKLDHHGKVVREHVRKSQFVYDDKGNLVEQVLYKTPGIKGVSDKDIEKFASGKRMRPRQGFYMLARYYSYRQFKSQVEVKDTWNAHWPSGARVQVYFSAAFDDNRVVLLQAMEAWNALVPEIQFIYAGTAEQTQVCHSCLTVARNPTLKGGTFQSAENDEGLIVYGRIEMGNTDSKTLFSVFAHELGHTLGLDHSSEGLMKTGQIKGKMVFPSQTEADLVRRFLR